MTASYFSSPFPLPAQRIVGLLSCQVDPLARSLQTRVLRCDKAAAADEPAKQTNQSKKAAKNSKKDEDEWEIELEDTVLFPEGGGQPWDHGFLYPEGDSATDPIHIHKVLRKGLQAVHMSSKPIQPGTQIKIELDWTRRLDLMQQHTGQHLLSSVFEERFAIDTLGWSLQPYPQPSYVELPRVPTPDEIQGALQTCNELIRQDCPITVDVALEGEEAQQRPEKIPADYVGGVVRHVQIHSNKIPSDRNPCCGTHAPSLALLQAMHILPNTTGIRGTNCRLYFLVGQRVLDNAASAIEATRLVALAHGCHQADVVSRTEAALTAQKEANKTAKKLRDELADFLAKKVVGRAEQAKNKKALIIRDDEDLESLSVLSARISKEASPELTFVLAGSTSTGSCPVLCLGQDAAATADALKEGFGGRLKGGGKGRWQGKLEGKLTKDDRKLLEAVVQT